MKCLLECIDEHSVKKAGADERDKHAILEILCAGAGDDAINRAVKGFYVRTFKRQIMGQLSRQLGDATSATHCEKLN